MRLPEIILDDRRFQDLVNEARLRINQRAPEWTEHNVSDPGITLIELFAWMTETIIFRLNRIPDKLHVALLELLGIQMEPPTPALCDIRFRLAAPAEEESVEIPGVSTEVGTLRTAGEESIVFQTDEDFTIPAAKPTAYAVERKGTFKDVGVAKGIAQPKGPDQLAFGTPPVVGDAIYLGFGVALGRLMMQIDVDCSAARGAGVDPEDPPLRWEVSDGDGWSEAEVLDDRTGGFNYGSGIVELQLPTEHSQTTVAGKRAFWLRCRLDDKTRSGGEATAYSHPPEIYSITAAPIGALIPASHAQHIGQEILGTSDGTPGQTFKVRQPPMLPTLPHETLEVVDPDSGSWQRWESQDSFVESGEHDNHYVLDHASGEIDLGPAIRSPDGGWRQFGAVPPKGAELRFTAYRHGGGRSGNVAAGTLNVMKTAIPGVAEATNPRPALGGVDGESLDSARQRASMELRTRYRAVTKEDFEFLSGEASPRVARVVCVPPNGDGAGPARVHIVPRVEPPDRKMDLEELTPDETLLNQVARYLDGKRLIGTRVELLPGKLRGVSVVVNLQAAPRADIARVEDDVRYALYTYLNPLVGGSLTGPGVGWEFGRALNQGELYGIVHSIDGVEFVKILRVYETDLKTGKQDSKPAGTHVELEPDELIASGTHIVKAEHPEI
jgi:predicted phage baseplate assembly protein